MVYVYVGACVVFGTLAGIAAYLYREGAIAQGKSEISLGPLKVKLGVKQNLEVKQDGEKSA